jgi:hypothetical protein
VGYFPTARARRSRAEERRAAAPPELTERRGCVVCGERCREDAARAAQAGGGADGIGGACGALGWRSRSSRQQGCDRTRLRRARVEPKVVRREAMNRALGMGNDCHMWCARRIGLVVRDVRLSRGTSRRAGRRRRRRRLLASGAAGAADDVGLRVVFLLSGGRRPRVGWRRGLRSERGGSEWQAPRRLAMAGAAHATSGRRCSQAQAPRDEGGIRLKIVVVCLAVMSATATIGNGSSRYCARGGCALHASGGASSADGS